MRSARGILALPGLAAMALAIGPVTQGLARLGSTSRRAPTQPLHPDVVGRGIRARERAKRAEANGATARRPGDVFLGDYVTARLIGAADCRQGVVVAVRSGHLRVQGQDGLYRCATDATVVPDANLFGETMEHAVTVRAALARGEYE